MESAFVINRLGFRWGSGRLRFTVTPEKQEKVRAHTVSLLCEVAEGRRRVIQNSLKTL